MTEETYSAARMRQGIEREYQLTIAAIVLAAGGSVRVLPEHLQAAKWAALTRLDEPTDKGITFLAVAESLRPAGQRSGDA